MSPVVAAVRGWQGFGRGGRGGMRIRGSTRALVEPGGSRPRRRALKSSATQKASQRTFGAALASFLGRPRHDIAHFTRGGISRCATIDLGRTPESSVVPESCVVPLSTQGSRISIVPQDAHNPNAIRSTRHRSKSYCTHGGMGFIVPRARTGASTPGTVQFKTEHGSQYPGRQCLILGPMLGLENGAWGPGSVYALGSRVVKSIPPLCTPIDRSTTWTTSIEGSPSSGAGRQPDQGGRLPARARRLGGRGGAFPQLHRWECDRPAARTPSIAFPSMALLWRFVTSTPPRRCERCLRRRLLDLVQLAVRSLEEPLLLSTPLHCPPPQIYRTHSAY